MRALPPASNSVVGPQGVDYERISELLIEMGEEFHKLGFPKVLEDIESDGRIGQAARNPRDRDSRRLIGVFLKDIARELVKEQQDLRRHAQVQPGPQGSGPRVTFPQTPAGVKMAKAYVGVLHAKQLLDATWSAIRGAVDD